MRKLFLLGLLITLGMGCARAQVASGTDTAGMIQGEARGGEVPTECGGQWTGRAGASCTFQCAEGDYLYIWGNVNRDIASYLVAVEVKAACGGVAAECTCRSTLGCACETYGEDVAQADDADGLCHAQTGIGALVPSRGQYYCSRVTPEEAAELEQFGEGLLIKMPQP